MERSERHVILGLSGGVDSAVSAALLLRAGFRVTGLWLQTGAPDGPDDAAAVARALGIPFRTMDVRDALETAVCAPFDRAYRQGRTPNPCILCNPAVKFRALEQTADALGAEYLATGHYARAEHGALLCGRPENDQSYMLCRITRPQLRRLLLPLGGFTKPEVRALAGSLGLPVAEKPDSMEICFIPDRDYAAWLAERGTLPPPGRFLFGGRDAGPHGGIWRYTVGQRVPGLVDGEKAYVREIDAAANTVTLCRADGLLRTEFTAASAHWLTEPQAAPFRAAVRVRHTRTPAVPCTVTPSDGRLHIACGTPVRAPAPGQSAVLYGSDRVLVSGLIE